MGALVCQRCPRVLLFFGYTAGQVDSIDGGGRCWNVVQVSHIAAREILPLWKDCELKVWSYAGVCATGRSSALSRHVG